MAAHRAGASRRTGLSPSGDRFASGRKPVSEALRTVARAWASERTGRRSGPGRQRASWGLGGPRGPGSQALAPSGRRSLPSAASSARSPGDPPCRSWSMKRRHSAILAHDRLDERWLLRTHGLKSLAF